MVAGHRGASADLAPHSRHVDLAEGRQAEAVGRVALDDQAAGAGVQDEPARRLAVDLEACDLRGLGEVGTERIGLLPIRLLSMCCVYSISKGSINASNVAGKEGCIPAASPDPDLRVARHVDCASQAGQRRAGLAVRYLRLHQHVPELRPEGLHDDQGARCLSPSRCACRQIMGWSRSRRRAC